MNKKQALALLSLIADLYNIINMPDPEAVVAMNGRGHDHDVEDVQAAQPMTAK